MILNSEVFLSLFSIAGTKDFDNGFFYYTRVFYPMVLDVELEKLLKNKTKLEYRKITGKSDSYDYN